MPQSRSVVAPGFARMLLASLACLAVLGSPVGVLAVEVEARASSPVPVEASGADPWAELLPGERGAVAGRFADELSAYRIDAELDPAAGTIAGVAEVRVRNTAGVPLEEVWFRLFPNAAYYGEGGLAVAGVTVGGVATETSLALEETALRVALPEPLPPGAETTLRLPFETVVPVDSGGSYGIFGRDSATGAWALAGWHPTLAVYDPGTGWNLTPPTAAGDPTYAASSLFDVRLTLPATLAVVATGVETGEGRRAAIGGGPVERRFVAGPAREFTMVVDDSYVPSRVEAGEVAVVAWAEPERAGAAARAAARAAADLVAYGERFGAYPFRELELAEAPLEGALAVAWSGIVFLDGDGLLGGYGQDDALAFETVVAHEVAHLWWGALAGTDSNRHPWVQEGLATVSSLGALAWAGDPEAARKLAGDLGAGAGAKAAGAGRRDRGPAGDRRSGPDRPLAGDLRQGLARLPGDPGGDRGRGVLGGAGGRRRAVAVRHLPPDRPAGRVRGAFRRGSRRALGRVVRRDGDDGGEDRRGGRNARAESTLTPACRRHPFPAPAMRIVAPRGCVGALGPVPPGVRLDGERVLRSTSTRIGRPAEVAPRWHPVCSHRRGGPHRGPLG
jgi:hypothetical protein